MLQPSVHHVLWNGLIKRPHTVPKLTPDGPTNMKHRMIFGSILAAKDFATLSKLMQEKDNQRSYDGLGCPHEWPDVFTMFLLSLPNFGDNVRPALRSPANLQISLKLHSPMASDFSYCF